ncbi:PTS glucose transporter subunit IIA [Neobacillus niacini]|uniref:PTS sugar transporter subunit IIA n=1 Tax=Neobacillus niacini TaxID=86668 RepID=UPI00052F6596|nr:PTS glucose transporter subunit IIA [Neobacillus niacini]KGM46365.1 PTS glucose transporter subunit IIA [Neobacillus niacini]MEC1525614.1 PTS glucose transporter subunit IIA [Neobacillus niacini]
MVFSIFKKSKLKIYAPVTGDIKPLEEVPDPVFSQKMMGEGIAILPKEGKVYSPVDGTVILIAATKHAVGIRANDGTEILIHVGLETVSLNGKGFRVAVNEGDKISVGQMIMEVDWEYISINAKSKITPIVITNSEAGNKQYTLTQEKNAVQGKTVIISGS